MLARSVLAAIEAATDCTRTVTASRSPPCSMSRGRSSARRRRKPWRLATGSTPTSGGCAGLLTALVLTGITSREEAEASTIRADGITPTRRFAAWGVEVNGIHPSKLSSYKESDTSERPMKRDPS